MKPIYLDHSATTPLCQDVIDVMTPYLTTDYGNPSSMHTLGIHNRKAINTARKTMAHHLRCHHEDIIFTSGGTEASNLAIIGLAKAYPQKKRIITSKIEHKATLNSFRYLESIGYEAIYLDVDQQGFILREDLKKVLTEDTLLLSLIWGHNEIGTIHPVKEMIELCHQNDVFVHLDAIQMVGKLDVNVLDYPCDLMSISAHKIYGPKGVGCLYKKKDIRLEPIIYGGGHEYQLRAGTENIIGIIGFAKAFEISYQNIDQRNKILNELSTYVFSEISKFADIKLNGPKIGDFRLPGHLSISFNHIDSYQLSFALDRKAVYVSTGSACNSNIIEPSHVISMVNHEPSYAHGTLRLTLGHYQTKEDMDQMLQRLREILE